MIPFPDYCSRHLSNIKHLVRILLLLATILHPCHTASEWKIEYKQKRTTTFKIKPEQMLKDIHVNLRTDLSFPEPMLFRRSSYESPICLPVGDYRNESMGYAVCNTAPSHSYIEKLVRDTVSENNTRISMNCFVPFGIERSRPRFQCMRFFIRILDHERGVHVSNLTATLCPGLSVASLLYLHPYLRRIQIIGLPLQQDPSNITLTCPMSSGLELLFLQNNGLTSPPFHSCPSYYGNLKYVLLENQQLRLDDKPMFKFPNSLIYLSYHRCSLQNLPRSIFDGLIHLQMLNISNNNMCSFHNDVFHDLVSLVVLRIDSNVLTTLNMSVFQRLTSLQYLHLRRNYLRSIAGEVAILPSLRVIDISHNM